MYPAYLTFLSLLPNVIYLFYLQVLSGTRWYAPVCYRWPVRQVMVPWVPLGPPSSDMTAYSSTRRRSSITFQDYTRIKEALNQLKEQKKGIKRPAKENHVRNSHPQTTAIVRALQFLVLGIVVAVVLYGVLHMVEHLSWRVSFSGRSGTIWSFTHGRTTQLTC